MSVSGAGLVVRALKEEGVRWVFGIPGTHNIELYDAMLDEPALTPVLVTDEQCASFMGDGVARASGSLAALSLVPGAGLTHAMSGIAECYLDQIPLLVLLCGIRQDTGRAYQLHDVDQCAMVTPVAKRVFRPTTHAELYHAVVEAARLAKQAPCGPAVVEIPANLYLFRASFEEAAPPAQAAAPEVLASELEAIVGTLNGARQIAIYAGLGAQGATRELLEAAEALDAVVYTTISGKGVFPEDHPRFVWNLMGRSAPPALRALEKDFDCVLAIGARFGEVATASYGFDVPEKLIHVDVDSKVFNRNYKARHAIQADAGAFLRGLLSSPRLEKRPRNETLIALLREAHAKTLARLQEPTDAAGTRVAPSRLFDALARVCGPDTVYVTDSGNGTFLAMEQLRLTKPRSFLGPVDYSCMGYCVPAAIGAKLAAPDRPVVALAGDGAFLMTGMELATASAYGVGVMVFLLRDRELSQIAQFQRAALSRETCTEVSDYSARDLARALGAEFLELSRGDDADRVVREARVIAEGGKPVLIDVAIDYSRPTFFSDGVILTNFLRFPWKDRLRLVGRVLSRKVQARMG